MKRMNKKEIILICTLLVIALFGLIIVKTLQSEDGANVQITINGEIYGNYDLYSQQSISISDTFGKNEIIIEDGYVYMKEADCPDQYCVQHAKIHYNHETIICLPHELVVEIVGGETSDIDVSTH